MSSGTVHVADLCMTAQNYWKQSRCMRNEIKPITHAHSGPKRTQGVAPTAQTREEATLLMLI